MLRYIIRRIFTSIISFIIFTIILFFGINLLIPSDFTSTWINTAGERRSVAARLGLDQPLPVQYLRWLGNIFRGDLGPVFTQTGEGGSVTTVIMAELPATLVVFVIGSVIAFIAGIWLGSRLAWNVPKWLTSSAVFSSIAFYTAFPPWLSFLLGFIIIEQWYKATGTRIARVSFDALAWTNSPYSIRELMMLMIIILLCMLGVYAIINIILWRFFEIRVPGFVSFIGCILIMLGVWAMLDIVPYAVDVVRVAFVPLLTFTLLSFGDTMLMMRSSMLDTQHETYITLARAKGVKEGKILTQHAARNAILPVISRFVINLPYLLTAVVIIERATDWTGLGDVLFNAIYNQNTNIYMGIMVIVALVTLASRIALDILYALLDPRIRLGNVDGGI